MGYQMFNRLAASITLVMMLSSCTTMQQTSEKPKLTLSPVAYSDMEGWGAAQQEQTFIAFEKTCARLLKSPADKEFGLGIKAKDWQVPCQNLPNPKTTDAAAAKAYFEAYFTPYSVGSGSDYEGLFTGYYEASLRGSPVRTGVYQTPLRARPSDLVMVNLGEFIPDLKGQRIAGRVKDGQLKPYEDRKSIETGKLPKDMDVPIYWVDSAVDAFFLQVQGSGVVTLPDGSTQRIGYDGQNGHPYTAIGKELIARGALTKDNVSMQTIRDWLAAHPKEAVDVMRTNPSYVFFKKLDGSGPVGGEGVVLTPEVSIAVDRSVWPYGLPMYVDIEHPQDGGQQIRKLMVAQDTGGAIKGIIRGDFFWGYGAQAAANAGPMKSSGKLWVLLPKTSTPHVPQ
jgi:membrane-bound lytic murein transglycosylase A